MFFSINFSGWLCFPSSVFCFWFSFLLIFFASYPQPCKLCFALSFSFLSERFFLVHNYAKAALVSRARRFLWAELAGKEKKTREVRCVAGTAPALLQSGVNYENKSIAFDCSLVRAILTTWSASTSNLIGSPDFWYMLSHAVFQLEGLVTKAAMTFTSVCRLCRVSTFAT